MKVQSLKIFLFFLLHLWLSSSCNSVKYKNNTNKVSITTKSIRVAAPFKMPTLKLIKYPTRIYDISKFGAVEGGVVLNRNVITNVITLCNEAGGGTVLIPDGKWLTGKIHLQSNVNLHLQDNAELIFSDDYRDYLPAVQSSWEGMECYNYSPLIYAFNCENVTLSGKGKLSARIDKWEDWYERPPIHIQGLKMLYEMGVKKIPVNERDMTKGEYSFRPQFIQFNRCSNIVIENLTIRNSPFWTIHLLLCNGAILRGLDIKAYGHNNDGVDPEMTKNLLIENCVFEQGDDAIAIKSGRDQDGWRLNTATENVVIRNCIIKNGHQLLAIGSEISGGVRNVYLHDCLIPTVGETLFNNIVFIKTNFGRGGFIENIHVKNIKATKLSAAILGIDTDVFYQWKNLVPVYEKKLTNIRDIYISNITVDEVGVPFSLLGDNERPIKNITVKNINILHSFAKESIIKNVIGIKSQNVNIKK